MEGWLAEDWPAEGSVTEATIPGRGKSSNEGGMTQARSGVSGASVKLSVAQDVSGRATSSAATRQPMKVRLDRNRDSTFDFRLQKLARLDACTQTGRSVIGEWRERLARRGRFKDRGRTRSTWRGPIRAGNEPGRGRLVVPAENLGDGGRRLLIDNDKRCGRNTVQ